MATPVHLLLALAAIATATPPPGVAASASSASTGERILGVNYGTLGDNLPPPQSGLELARSAGASAVRFYDANATMLAAAAASGLEFVPSVPNELIPSLARSQRAEDGWVAATLLPFRGNPRLRHLFVGNEVLSDPTAKSRWPRLVPAMANVHGALRRHGMGAVKVSTTLSMHELEGQNVFPPSAGAVVRPLLGFLDRTGSPLFVDAYTYFAWSANHTVVPLPYALLEPPSPGAAGYCRCCSPAMVLAVFNEDLKWGPGPGTERHWGLFYSNGSLVYEVDLTGRRPLASYRPLPPASESKDRPYPVVN